MVIPTKDRPALLRETLRALEAQLHPAREVVIVNDGGAPVDEAVRNVALPIRVLVHPVSKTQPVALNWGIRSASCEWIAFCDDDDLFAPSHLQGLAAAAASDASGGALYYSDVSAFDATPEKSIGRLVSEFDPARLRVTNYITPSAVLFHRRLFDDVGALDESLPNYWDWDFFLRASAVTTPRRVPEAWTHYRVHAGSIQTALSQQAADVRPGQLRRLCEKHGLGELPVKHLFDVFTR